MLFTPLRLAGSATVGLGFGVVVSRSPSTSDKNTAILHAAVLYRLRQEEKNGG